jgi:hypothetical protein
MANRKMTFSFPEELADRFVRVVPSSRRSRYIADLIEEKMHQRDRILIEACEAVNADPELNRLTEDWQSAIDPIEEPWDESASR